MDGILNINKPAGKTSFNIVALVKRLTGERRVGHAGTLDPEATGVLPICLGKGTRVIEFLVEAHKVYRTVIELGVSTDTYDGTGKIIQRGDISCITKDLLVMTLDSFRGNIRQIPPMYSALKHRGQPLYHLARAGKSVARDARPITIYRLDLIKYELPYLTLEIECSKGTYIRSFANDLGEKLGCGAYMKELTRSSYGIFDIGNAITPGQFEEAVVRGNWEQHLYPIDSVLEHLPPINVDSTGEAAIKTGRPPQLNNAPETDTKYLRAYNPDGKFLAILTRDKKNSLWQPKKVFL